QIVHFLLCPCRILAEGFHGLLRGDAHLADATHAGHREQPADGGENNAYDQRCQPVVAEEIPEQEDEEGGEYESCHPTDRCARCHSGCTGGSLLYAGTNLGFGEGDFLLHQRRAVLCQLIQQRSQRRLLPVLRRKRDGRSRWGRFGYSSGHDVVLHQRRIRPTSQPAARAASSVSIGRLRSWLSTSSEATATRSPAFKSGSSWPQSPPSARTLSAERP